MNNASISSNVINYIHFYNLDVKTIDKKSHKKIYNKEEERQVLELEFSDAPEKLKEEYLDMYEEIQLEVISIIRFVVLNKSSNGSL